MKYFNRSSKPRSSNAKQTVFHETLSKAFADGFCLRYSQNNFGLKLQAGEFSFWWFCKIFWIFSFLDPGTSNKKQREQICCEKHLKFTWKFTGMEEILDSLMLHWSSKIANKRRKCALFLDCFLALKRPREWSKQKTSSLSRKHCASVHCWLRKLSLAMSGVYFRSQKITGRMIFGAMMLNALIYRKNKNKIIRLGDKEKNFVNILRRLNFFWLLHDVV